MGWPALGAHISSKWWGCSSAHPVAVAADRSCVPCEAVASTRRRAPMPSCNVVLSPLGARRSTAATVVPSTYSTCSGGQ